MYLILTRSFPPEVGGMQNLMWGLARSLSKYNLIKVYADHQEGYEKFDTKVSFCMAKHLSRCYNWMEHRVLWHSIFV